MAATESHRSCPSRPLSAAHTTFSFQPTFPLLKLSLTKLPSRRVGEPFLFAVRSQEDYAANQNLESVSLL